VKIGGWHIDGFGIFHDFEVSLSDGLTVFLGPNEAGKSTLLGFLRAALFGFPGRRNRVAQYPPLRGGRHGGRLILCGPEGEVIVERLGGRKNGLRLNGYEATDQDLRALLGGADENVFCSVFAFSLSEMQSFEWLRADQIRERIFSAGIAGAGASARKVIETLEDEASSLLRPRGASRVRDLGEQIEQAERKLKLAQAEAERYVSLGEEHEMWSAKSAALFAEESVLRGRQRAIEIKLDLWSDWERARQELAALETIEAFPDQPEARLAALAGRVEAAQTLVMGLEEERTARQRLRAQIQIDDREEIICDHAEEFHGRLALHRDRLESLAALRERNSLATPWNAMGVCVAFLAGWLVGRHEATAGVLLMLVDLLAAGFVLYQRIASLARCEREIAAWEEPVREWLASSISGEALIAEFISARARCHRNRDLRAKASSLDEALGESQARLEAAQRELESAEEALRAFLREAGATGEGDFHDRLRIFRKRHTLSALIQEREARIGEPPGSSEEWSNELPNLIERLREVRKQRDEAIVEQSLADAELRRIAESTAIPTLGAELERLHTEQAVAVRKWRIATLAEALVARTLQEFTRSRQPAVLEEASGAFARVTAGAYERILQDEDRENLIVLDRYAQHKRPEELSRGTAEQLYLCLRLGLASEFARRSVALPLIMDDVLVNFDPQRARGVAEELARFSRQHQVLIFTCHPETAQLFAEVAPETRVIPMERQGASAAEE
jgi:uncharacterized protein YhaN